jgi:ParB family chromosome partitioning protein
MTIHSDIHPENGSVLSVPLNHLKASRRNARKTPHRPADIETLAASIALKGVLQPLVVEPERDGEGRETGNYLVTIGEGRRQALLLLAKRKAIKKSHEVRCILDLANDAFEISLDENVTRFAMHPADQFEAFQQLAQERGFGPEEIAARFGVTATVVRQRLRLAVVSPALITLYREECMTLDQLMAFTITDDHARQEAVWEGLSWNKEPPLIRRLLTEDHVKASDRRAKFVGAEAYLAAGGGIERDLFSDDQGGYFTDPTLLDRLAREKLALISDGVLAEGWKWTTPALDFPGSSGMRRVYPERRDLSSEDQVSYENLTVEYEALASEHEGDDALDDAVAVRFTDLETQIEALEAKRYAFDPDEQIRAGVFVILGHDGQARSEPGFIRPEDDVPQIKEPSASEGQLDQGVRDRPTDHGDNGTEEPDDLSSPLSDKLVADLTAHRTAALTDRLGGDADLALTALVHVLALQTFSLQVGGSCLTIRISEVHLPSHAMGIQDTRAGQAAEAKHATWAADLPRSSELLWTAILAMDQAKRLSLLAHCVSRSIDAVQSSPRRTGSLIHADQLASALRLDMADYWTPTVDSYLSRVTKGRILEAVREGVSADAATRIEGLKKQPMAETAEELLAGRRWVPAILRTEVTAFEPPSLIAAE